jgi:undecaprenyl-diphosphatase
MRRTIFFSVLQLLGETLPISSSGHLLLLKQYLTTLTIGNNDFYLSHAFDEWIHLLHVPTLICLALFFWDTWWPLLRNPIRWHRLIFKLASLTLLTDVITTLFFVALEIIPPFSFPLPLGFFITMCALFSLAWCPKEGRTLFNTRVALILGAVQGAALLPGISRFASVFVASRWLGLAPRRAFALAWMVQVPLIIGAFGKSLLFFSKHSEVVSQLVPIITWPFIMILIFATALSYILLLGAYQLALRNQWWVFGWYLIVPLGISLML